MRIDAIASYLFNRACGCPGTAGRVLRYLVYGLFAAVYFLGRRKVPFTWRFALREP